MFMLRLWCCPCSLSTGNHSKLRQRENATVPLQRRHPIMNPCLVTKRRYAPMPERRYLRWSNACVARLAGPRVHLPQVAVGRCSPPVARSTGRRYRPRASSTRLDSPAAAHRHRLDRALFLHRCFLSDVQKDCALLSFRPAMMCWVRGSSTALPTALPLVSLVPIRLSLNSVAVRALRGGTMGHSDSFLRVDSAAVCPRSVALVSKSPP
jgi:hypothetical protein